MAVLVALLDQPAAAAVRRTLPPGSPQLIRAASLAALRRLLERRPLEGCITDPAHLDGAALAALRRDWPTLPIIVTVTPRAEDAARLRSWRQAGATALVAAGVEDALRGAVLLRHAYRTARWRALAELARAARCETALQHRIWQRLLAEADRPPPLAKLAADVDLARETLSRQFAAGDAPTLKRAADAARVVFAAQLLVNPACSVSVAARLLGFAGPAHLRTTARRITGGPVGELAALGAGGALAAFLRGHARVPERARRPEFL